MGCHLHEITETINTNYFGWYKSFTDDQVRLIRNVYADYSNQAVCFDGGEIDDFIDLDFHRIDELIMLPFDVCWLEFADSNNSNYSVIGFLLINMNNDITAINFKKLKDKRWMFDYACTRPKKGGHFIVHVLAQNIRDPGVIPDQMELVSRFLSAINCVNITSSEHIPPDKLQKARKKRGKLPLFSYRTLHIDLDRNASKSAGTGSGSHASPRLHLRRGHARQLSPGKYCWVRACVVGNKDAGIVHKEYKVK